MKNFISFLDNALEYVDKPINPSKVIVIPKIVMKTVSIDNVNEMKSSIENIHTDNSQITSSFCSNDSDMNEEVIYDEILEKLVPQEEYEKMPETQKKIYETLASTQSKNIILDLKVKETKSEVQALEKEKEKLSTEIEALKKTRDSLYVGKMNFEGVKRKLEADHKILRDSVKVIQDYSSLDNEQIIEYGIQKGHRIMGSK